MVCQIRTGGESLHYIVLYDLPSNLAKTPQGVSNPRLLRTSNQTCGVLLEDKKTCLMAIYRMKREICMQLEASTDIRWLYMVPHTFFGTASMLV
jgi:hypothetical protein